MNNLSARQILQAVRDSVVSDPTCLITGFEGGEQIDLTVPACLGGRVAMAAGLPGEAMYQTYPGGEYADSQAGVAMNTLADSIRELYPNEAYQGVSYQTVYHFNDGQNTVADPNTGRWHIDNTASLEVLDHAIRSLKSAKDILLEAHASIVNEPTCVITGTSSYGDTLDEAQRVTGNRQLREIPACLGGRIALAAGVPGRDMYDHATSKYLGTEFDKAMRAAASSIEQLYGSPYSGGNYDAYDVVVHFNDSHHAGAEMLAPDCLKVLARAAANV